MLLSFVIECCNTLQNPPSSDMVEEELRLLLDHHQTAIPNVVLACIVYVSLYPHCSRVQLCKAILANIADHLAPIYFDPGFINITMPAGLLPVPREVFNSIKCTVSSWFADDCFIGWLQDFRPTPSLYSTRQFCSPVSV